MVESDNGVTIIPELSMTDFNSKQRNMVRYFKNPEPVREIALVTHRSFVKKKLLELLTKSIIDSLPEKMTKLKKDIVVGVG